jgi:arsenite methyltransferase
MTMGSSQYELSAEGVSASQDSLFERCHWLYALCREYLFRDHTREITSALFPSGDPADGTRILELGCGPGLYACRFAKDFPQVTTIGIDSSKRLIRHARTRAENLHLQNCNFLEGDAQALGELAQAVDAVIVSRLFPRSIASCGRVAAASSQNRHLASSLGCHSAPCGCWRV